MKSSLPGISRTVASRCVLSLSCILFLFLGSDGSGSALAQVQEVPTAPSASTELAQPTEAVQTFFEQISNPNEIRNGLDALFRNSPFEENAKDDMVKTLTSKIESISEQFGRYISFEPIGVKRVGHDLVVLRYLYKCQNYPLVWYFIFYRPTTSETEASGKPWQIIHLYYDSQLNIPLWESGF